MANEGHPHRHVQPGDSFEPSASLHNDLVDLLAKFRKKGAVVKDGRPETSVEILIRNDTGDTVARYGVLAVGDPVLTPGVSLSGFKNNKLFKGIAPSPTAIVAVVQETIADGAIGRAVVAGLTQVQIDVSDAAHQYATPTTDPEHMESGATGRFKIVYKASGTGVVWGVILIGVDYEVAAYDVPGIVSTSDQWMGNGVKKFAGVEFKQQADGSEDETGTSAYFVANVSDVYIGGNLRPCLRLYDTEQVDDLGLEGGHGAMMLRNLYVSDDTDDAVGSLHSDAEGWILQRSTNAGEFTDGRFRFYPWNSSSLSTYPGGVSPDVFYADGKIVSTNLGLGGSGFAIHHVGVDWYVGQTAVTLGGTFVGGILTGTSIGSSTLAASAITGTLPASQVGGAQAGSGRIVIFGSASL